jgi:hypothetical protein
MWIDHSDVDPPIMANTYSMITVALHVCIYCTVLIFPLNISKQITYLLTIGMISISVNFCLTFYQCLSFTLSHSNRYISACFHINKSNSVTAVNVFCVT